MPQLSHRTALFAAIIAAGLLTFLLGPSTPTPTADTPSYLAVAADLQDGRWDAPHIRTIGYPLLLLVSGSTPEPNRALIAVQLLLHTAAVCAAVWLLLRMEAPIMAAAGVATLAMLPPMTEYAFYAMTESLSQSMLVVGIIALIAYLQSRSPLTLGAAAIMLGALGVVKPSFQFLPVGLAALVVFMGLRGQIARSVGWQAAGALLAGAVLIMGPVAAYNQRHFDVSGLSAFTGIILSTRTYTVIDRLPPDEPLRELLITTRNDYMQRSGPISAQNYIFAAYPQMEGDLASINAELLRLNLGLITSEPLNLLRVVATANATYWLPGSTRVANAGSALLHILWTAVDGVVVGAFLTLSSIVFALHLFALSLKRPLLPSQPTWGVPWVLLLSVIAYNVVMSTTVGVGIPRYREPTEILMLMAIALGALLLNAYRQHLNRALAPPA